MRTRFDGLLRRLVTLADGVGDRYRDEHGGRRSDPTISASGAVAIAGWRAPPVPAPASAGRATIAS
jgi:hypothetical protein